MNTQYSSLVNVEEGLTRLGGNQEIFEKLLNTFVSKDYVAKFKKSKSDPDTLAAMVHQIKGVSANLSLNHLYKGAIEYEYKIKDNINTADDDLEFERILERTIDYIVSEFIE